MNDFQEATVETALREMFAGKHFSICTVDKCMTISGCIPDKSDYDCLHALHCVNFSAMSRKLRSQCMAATLRIFERPGFDMEMIRVETSKRMALIK